MSPCDTVKTIFGYARMIFAVTRFGKSALIDISAADFSDLSSYRLKKIRPVKGVNHTVILYGLLHDKVSELVNSENVDIFDSEYEGNVNGDYLLITEDALFNSLNDVELNYILTSYSGLIVKLGAMNEFSAWGAALFPENRFFSTPFSVSVSAIAPLPVAYYPINALSGFYPAYLASQQDFKDSGLLDKLTKGNLFGTHLSILKTERAIYREFGKIKFVCGTVLGVVAMKYKDPKGSVKDSYVNFKMVGERMLRYGITDMYPELGNDLTRTVWKEMITEICLNEIESRIKKPLSHMNIPDFLVGWMQYIDSNTESAIFTAKLMNLCDRYGRERPNLEGNVGVFMSLFPYAYVSFCDKLKPEFRQLWKESLQYAEKYGITTEQSNYGFDKLYEISTKAVTKYQLPDALYASSNANRKFVGTPIKERKVVPVVDAEDVSTISEDANLSMMEAFLSKKDKQKPDLEAAEMPQKEDVIDCKPLTLQKESDIKVEEQLDWKDMNMFFKPSVTMGLDECQNTRINLMPKHLAQKFRSGEYDFKKTYAQWIKDVNGMYEKLPWDFFLFFKQRKGNGLRADAIKKCLSGNHSQKNKIVIGITNAYNEKLTLIAPKENVMPANMSLDDLEKITGITTAPEPMTENVVKKLIQDNAVSTKLISDKINAANDVVDSAPAHVIEEKVQEKSKESAANDSIEEDIKKSSEKLAKDMKDIALKMEKKEFPKYKMVQTAVTVNDDEASYDIVNINLLGEGDITVSREELSQLQTSIAVLLKCYTDRTSDSTNNDACMTCDDYKQLNSELAANHAAIEQKVADLHKTVEQLTQQNLAFETKLSDANLQIDSLSGDLNRVTLERDGQVDKVKELEEQADKVPKLSSELQDIKNQLNIAHDDLEMCENATKQALDDVKTAQASIKQMEDELCKLKEINSNLLNDKDTLQRTLEELDEKILARDQEILQMHEIIKNKEQQYSVLEESIPSRIDNAVTNAVETKDAYIKKLENGECHRCIELLAQIDDLAKDENITPSLLPMSEEEDDVLLLRQEIDSLKAKLENAEFMSASEELFLPKIKPGREMTLPKYDSDLRDTYVQYVTMKPKNALEARARYVKLQKVQSHGNNVDTNATLYYRNQPVCQSSIADGNYIVLDFECPCKKSSSAREWMQKGYVPLMGMVCWETVMCSCYVVPSKLENVEKFISLSSGIAVQDVELLNQLLG